MFRGRIKGVLGDCEVSQSSTAERWTIVKVWSFTIVHPPIKVYAGEGLDDGAFAL